MKIQYSLMLASALLVGLTLGACSDYKSTGGAEDTEQAQRADVESRATITVNRFKSEDPSLDKFFDTAAAYAVFPRVAKGGVGIGGARGHGVLYEGGRVVGYTTLTQGTLGVQLGGQTYSQIIFMKDAHLVSDFKAGTMEFAAQASAVAASRGAGANADYESGVAVFTLGEKGLMFEASIGGQKFSYQAK